MGYFVVTFGTIFEPFCVPSKNRSTGGEGADMGLILARPSENRPKMPLVAFHFATNATSAIFNVRLGNQGFHGFLPKCL